MDYCFAHRTRAMKSSAIRDLLKAAEQPGLISFGGGLPAPGCFPREAVQLAFNEILDGSKAFDALQYSATEGYLPLRKIIQGIMSTGSCTTSIDEILITSGSQQALDLLGKVFINPGDLILVENPTYLGALQAFNSYEPWYVAVATDGEGMIPEALESILSQCQPKLAYLAPTFQNPTGRTMSPDRRRRILELLQGHQVILVEDDPYYELYYSGNRSMPIKSLDRENSVVYLSTFSKTLAPAFRLGWAVAGTEIIERLVQAKQGCDLNSGALVQMAAASVMASPSMSGHLDKLRREYKLRRDAMLNALEEFFPSGAHWNHPEGGMFVWLELPEAFDTSVLLPGALQQGVAYVPGEAFFAADPARNCMRLNFSNASPREIREGIKRLSRLLPAVIPAQSKGYVV